MNIYAYIALLSLLSVDMKQLSYGYFKTSGGWERAE